MVTLKAAAADARLVVLRENCIRAEMRRLMKARTEKGLPWQHNMDEFVLMRSQERGDRVQLTYDERVEHKIKHTRPTGISWEEVQRRNKERANAFVDFVKSVPGTAVANKTRAVLLERIVSVSN